MAVILVLVTEAAEEETLPQAAAVGLVRRVEIMEAGAAELLEAQEAVGLVVAELLLLKNLDSKIKGILRGKNYKKNRESIRAKFRG